MDRARHEDLELWRERPTRKPLVLRGARQVGKTFLVRDFAKARFDHLVELNFERDPGQAALFEGRDPHRIVRRLEVLRGHRIEPGRALLFLDEVQAAPVVFAALRYFQEQLPDLHVVAAGSLLDLALAEPAHSVPVGRIEYLHVQPLRFTEFLRALDRASLAEWIERYEPLQKIPSAIHRELLQELRAYFVVGGMPEAVASYAAKRSLFDCDRAKQALLAAIRDDFGKYGARVRQDRVRRVFTGIPRTIGDRFKYTSIDRLERARDLGPALDLLRMARVCHLVRHTSAEGLPLGAEASERNFKVLFLDVGLVSTARGLSLADFELADDVMQIGSGSLCEQLVGQELLASLPAHQDPELHYWMREQKNSSAEVDYVIAAGSDVVPVEVKAGKPGTLRSLHAFLHEKRRSFAVRLNSEPPSWLDSRQALPDGSQVELALLSLPLYLAGEVRRLCARLREERFAAGAPSPATG